MDFSVVIPSRNRPDLLSKAIQSVLEQTHGSVEVVVVDDGSDGDFEARYRQLEAQVPAQVRFIHLEKTMRGHGPSYAINRGAEQARGTYVCFLDDDDYWVDADHLRRAWASVNEGDAPVDLYFTNQNAYVGDRLVAEDLWLADMGPYVRRGHKADSQGAYAITVAELMSVCDGRFAHLNTHIVRRELYLGQQGMDENIRYECEWDLYLRLLAVARAVKYCPQVVSRHNVPDPAKTVNVSTAVSQLAKLLFRSYVLDKALLFSPLAEIRQMAARHKIYTLKKMAQLLSREGKVQQAYFYGRAALIRHLDVKWWLYCAYLAARSLLSGR
jgi:hypothetical protein